MFMVWIPKMIQNCKGCFEELRLAYEEVKRGNYIATSKNMFGLFSKGHLCIIVIDKKGRIII